MSDLLSGLEPRERLLLLWLTYFLGQAGIALGLSSKRDMTATISGRTTTRIDS